MNLCGFEVGLNARFFLIAGPCVIESEALALATAADLKKLTGELGIPFIYKSSFDKANRSSLDSFRGLGMEEGLRILQKVKDELQVPVLTDVHEDTPLDEVCDVVDVLQTPAFLCRQTNFIQSVARTGKPVNIKKGQFLAPWDMKNVVDKARATGNAAQEEMVLNNIGILHQEARRHDLLWRPRRVTERLREILLEERPDVVLSDQISFGATVALRALGVRYASFVTGHPASVPGEGELYRYPHLHPPGFTADAGDLAELFTRPLNRQNRLGF